MNYNKIKNLKDSEFKRLTGIEHSTFKRMISILRSDCRKRQKSGGRKPTKTVETRLLMTLEYWREYRTYFHIGKNYNLSESQAFCIIRRVEDVLIKSREFTLPGKKALLKSDMEYEVVMIDATECPVERPKKSRSDITPARKSVTPRKHKSL